MKKIVLAFAFCLLALSLGAQEQNDDARAAASKEYSDKYDMLVSRLGADGVGIETVLENWEEVDPDNRKLLLAKYSYYITKAQTTSVEYRPGKKYLGKEPLLSLKDSLGKDMNYFEVISYDDSLFSIALKNIDKAIKVYPSSLDLPFMKAAALISYENESPDMALAYVEGLVDQYYSDPSKEWDYNGQPVNKDFFVAAMQEYCYTFFNLGTPASHSAFKSLSEKMSAKEPNETMFISNIGSYYLVAAGDSKQALKYYNKVLKIKPNDYTAAKNCVLISRKQKDAKLEKKYLPILIATTEDDGERLSAEARLKALQ